MTQYVKPFEPITGGTIRVNNATSATTAASLPDSAITVAIWNNSTTATAYWRCRPDFGDTIAAQIPVAGGTAGDMSIPPLQLVRLSVPAGAKKFSIISSAADSYVEITPGIGN